MMNSEQFRKKFLGSMLGVALGDAIGASREGYLMVGQQEIEFIANSPHTLRYTDDTHMTIGVAESLIECKGFDGAHMAKRFIDNYDKEPWRGYGPGPPAVFRRIKRGEPWDKASANLYSGGSFGNGAAMRIAPIGLFFWNDHAQLKQAAFSSSLITHSHILGMEGAALQALAIALAVAQDPDRPVDTSSFISRLLDLATQDIYLNKIAEFPALLKHANDRQMVAQQLGHGIEAFNSVPTAIFAFLSHPEDFASAVVYAVNLGGDTDTIASMTGAISGAYLGVDALPTPWQERLENKKYIANLAHRLWEVASPREKA